MDTVYVVFVVILFLLAISDLVVGVTNDAVNFLVSAIGSKAAPFGIIMIIASAGVLFGATFSSGMMEVARKGIFHPEMFYFKEIMVIFLAVMLTDIILLDMFNTFGMPTSTTVSIVFELLGAAVAVSLIKLNAATDAAVHLGDYINSDKALAIILGILLSVVVAFTIGAVVQYIARMLFTFNYKKPYKYFGALWGGIALTAITYFILVKGAKGASFITEEVATWITDNKLLIIAGSFILWTVIFQLLKWLFNTNILRIVVFVGTFSLAMAFAGNDLVNFIGVPLAGLRSFQEYISAGSGNMDMQLTMEVLKESVQTPTHYLLIAGIIMVITLWMSKKARSVTATSVDLSRQSEGYERFGSTMFSRTLVRGFINAANFIVKVTPKPLADKVNKRFVVTEEMKKQRKQKDAPAFDLIRASVNLVVASILISFATSLKLPLSTTYVSFMVAMGTSLADGAWGRESAVYRVTGVLSVLGGWFITAFVAFSVAFLFANFIHWANITAVITLTIVAAFLVTRTRILHKRREELKEKMIAEAEEEADKKDNLFYQCAKNISEILQKAISLFSNNLFALFNENRIKLKKINSETNDLKIETTKLQNNLHHKIKELQAVSIDTGPYYVQVIDYLNELVNSLAQVIQNSYNHIDNNHKGLLPSQQEELRNLNNYFDNFFKELINLIQNNTFDKVDDLMITQKRILHKINKYRKNQIKRIKREEAGTRNSMLYLNFLSETKNLLIFSINTLKAQRDFELYSKTILIDESGG